MPVTRNMKFSRNRIKRRLLAVAFLALSLAGASSLWHKSLAQESSTPPQYPSTPYPTTDYPATANLPKRDLPPFNVSTTSTLDVPLSGIPAAKPAVESSISMSSAKQVYVGL